MKKIDYPKVGIWANQVGGEIHLSQDGNLVQRFSGDVKLAEVHQVLRNLLGDAPSDSPN